MKKFITTKTTLIIVGLVALLFNVVFWAIVGSALGHNRATGATLWISYAFVMVAFVVAAGVTFVKPKTKNASIALIPFFYATLGYMGVTLVLNIIFMAINTNKEVGWIFDLVLNSIAIIFFAIVLVLAYKHFSRVDDLLEKKHERVEKHFDLSGKVSSLLSLAEHDEVKAALVDFRRSLNFSSSASNEKTAEADQKLAEELDNLEIMIKSNASVEEQLRAVKFAKVALDERNRAVAKAR